MNENLVAMARAAMHDERLSDGALYGKLAAEIERLRDASEQQRIHSANLSAEIERLRAALFAAIRGLKSQDNT